MIEDIEAEGIYERYEHALNQNAAVELRLIEMRHKPLNMSVMQDAGLKDPDDVRIIQGVIVDIVNDLKEITDRMSANEIVQ